MELISSIDEKCPGVNVIRKPNEDEIDEILSYGLIVKENPLRLRFKHRSFAEFFYVKAMRRIFRIHQENLGRLSLPMATRRKAMSLSFFQV